MTATSEPLRPHAGPQWNFLATPATIAIFGGARGGGKSWSLLLEAIRHIAKPRYSGIIFRRTYSSIRGPGGLLEASRELYSREGLNGHLVESPGLLWRFPTGSLIQFSHCQHDKNALDHRGREYAFIGFDEVTEMTEYAFWELLGSNRTTCGIRPYVRATCNPDPDHFIRRMVDWWIGEDGYPIPERSGKLRWFRRQDETLHWYDRPTEGAISFTFIPALLSDNPTLCKADPDYLSKLEALPLVERKRLLGGNWNVRPSAGQYFKRHYFEVIDAAPGDIRQRVRAWDLAATKPSETNADPDWTVGVRYAKLKDDSFVVEHVERLRESPLGVERALCNTAAMDGERVRIGLWQDPGQAGKSQAQHFARLLSGHTIKLQPATRDKLTYAGPVSSQAEAGNIRLVRGPWNEAFINVLESFPEGAHDDDVDALSLAHRLCAATDLDRLRALATR